MKNIKDSLLLMTCIALLSPTLTHAHYSTIEDEGVPLKGIVRHFKGEMELDRNEEGSYYSEFIFDGNSLIIENNKGYALVNGIPKPLEKIERDGVILPVYHRVNHIWNNIKLPANFLVDEFNYKVEENRLIYDKPLGIYEEEKLDEDEAESKKEDGEQSLESSLTENTTQGTDEIKHSESDEDITNGDTINNNAEKEDNKQEDENDDENELEDNPNDNDEIESDKPEEDNTDKENDDETEQDSESTDIPESTMKILNSTYELGKHFGMDSNYQEQQQHINDDNIIVLWSTLVHSNKRATLVIGKGNTVFRKLQGNLSEGIKFTVSDIVGKLREYEIKESIKVPLKETNQIHKDLYEKYKSDDVFIIQLQENNKMSFYIGF